MSEMSKSEKVIPNNRLEDARKKRLEKKARDAANIKENYQTPPVEASLSPNFENAKPAPRKRSRKDSPALSSAKAEQKEAAEHTAFEIALLTTNRIVTEFANDDELRYFDLWASGEKRAILDTAFKTLQQALQFDAFIDAHHEELKSITLQRTEKAIQSCDDEIRKALQAAQPEPVSWWKSWTQPAFDGAETLKNQKYAKECEMVKKELEILRKEVAMQLNLHAARHPQA